MLEKFLQEIISRVAGSGADVIVKFLFKKKNVNEFLIAKKLNITINQARNILYKLAECGLVYFTRKKDTKSGGWYIYFWTLNEKKCLSYYIETLNKEIERFEDLLNIKKTKQFYMCKTCGMEVTEEQALLNEFTCPECGEVFAMKDSTESIVQTEKEIQKLRNKVAEIKKVLDEIEAIAIAKVKKTSSEGKKKITKTSKKKVVAKKTAGAKKKVAGAKKKSSSKKRKK